MRLAGRGTMKRERDSDGGRDAHGAIFGLGGFERDYAVAPDDRDICALAAFFCDVGEDRARLPHEAHMMDVTATEVEAFDAEAIIFGGFVLFDVTACLERREQPEDVVLMQLEPLGKFRDAKFIAFAQELFEHVERVRNGLDNVVSFIASDHFFSTSAATRWTTFSAP